MNQESIEYYSERIEELIDGIDKGDIGQDHISNKYRWMHLLGLFLLKDSLDGGSDLFRQLYEIATEAAIKSIRDKFRSGKKIKVVFQSYSAAQWPAEGVYRRFESCESFDTSILVTPLDDRDEESCMKAYNQTLKWFRYGGYNVLEGIDPQCGRFRSWADFGEYPDIVFQLSSWHDCSPLSLQFTMLPLRCLLAYIPYGLQFAENQDKTFSTEAVFDKDIFNLVWRIYCDSRSSLEGYKNYQFLHGANAVFSGYAKMDYFYENRARQNTGDDKLWKVPQNAGSVFKRVIVAPHYSVLPKGLLLFSTFRKNAWFLLYLAKKYSDRISFVFKPHPNLRYAAVACKMFEDYESYDRYLAEWDALPNAKVVEESSYLEYFSTSDAMITDSVSFLGEYLYVGNPLLLLTRPEQGFLELGRKIVDSYYKTEGEDYVGIERFLNEVVVDGKDTMSAKRKAVFAAELDYVAQNGCKACDYIFEDIVKTIGVDL